MRTKGWYTWGMVLVSKPPRWPWVAVLRPGLKFWGMDFRSGLIMRLLNGAYIDHPLWWYSYTDSTRGMHHMDGRSHWMMQCDSSGTSLDLSFVWPGIPNLHDHNTHYKNCDWWISQEKVSLIRVHGICYLRTEDLKFAIDLNRYPQSNRFWPSCQNPWTSIISIYGIPER